MVSIDALRSHLHLDIDTGRLFWAAKPSKHSSVEIGDEAGCLNGEGYRVLGFMGRTLKSHRVVFALHHNRWPSKQIDHRNGVKDDNRPSNLREASAAENAQNVSARGAHRAGQQRGVYKVKNRWQAQITFQRRKVFLGSFETAKQAIAAREQAERIIFSHNLERL